MKRILLLLTIPLLIAACSKNNDPINLLEKKEKWKSDSTLLWEGSELKLKGTDLKVIYQPGLFTTFQNFELEAVISTDSSAIAGLRFHTDRKSGSSGYEVMIDNSKTGDWDRLDKTGSLKSIRNIYYNMCEDEIDFNLRIRVVENHIQIFINNYPVVDYTEPEFPFRTAKTADMMAGSGTFSIQTYYENTSLTIRKLSVKPLPQGEININEDDLFVRTITELHTRNFPLVDFHVHEKGDLTMDTLHIVSVKNGINYGIAANCGLKFPIQTDEELESYLNSIEGHPIFKAMQAEGREWVHMFSPDLVSRFDYAFTDAMTWTNNKGKRLRLWIPEETEVGDPEDFMEQLVSQIETVVREPISIYVNPTYLPEEIADRYDELWTDERIDRVILALKENNVALEINSRLKLPGGRVIEKARDAGIKFALGTNNTDSDNLGKLEWALEMVEEYELQPVDMWIPGERGGREKEKGKREKLKVKS